MGVAGSARASTGTGGRVSVEAGGLTAGSDAASGFSARIGLPRMANNANRIRLRSAERIVMRDILLRAVALR